MKLERDDERLVAKQLFSVLPSTARVSFERQDSFRHTGDGIPTGEATLYFVVVSDDGYTDSAMSRESFCESLLQALDRYRGWREFRDWKAKHVVA
jgi:hypothetical protein